MAVTSHEVAGSVDGPTSRGVRRDRRPGAETKAAVKTTELYAYLAAVAGVLLASYLVKATSGHGDYFRADRAWLYAVLLTVGYLGSRGLAKAGSPDHRDD